MLSREKTFRTVVGMPKMERVMQLGDRFVFLGSCFAEHIGRRFAEYGLPVLCNPFGVLYNPLSLLTAVQGAALKDEAHHSVFFQDGTWHSWSAGSQVSATDEASCRQLMASLYDELHQALGRASFLFVTLGTRVCYRLTETGQVVANCHRMPAAQFEEYAIGVGECAEVLTQLVDEARGMNPDLQIVFTVSPYRYAKYGFHGNQLSKSVLLLGVEEVCSRRDRCTYLPIYEIFMDELRDYRFYAEDMCHPSPVAVDYVWNRLVEECMDTRLQAYLSDYEPLRRALAHRPFNPDSPQYHDFLQKIESMRKVLAGKYGYSISPHSLP